MFHVTEKSTDKLENMNVKANLDPPEGGFNWIFDDALQGGALLLLRLLYERREKFSQSISLCLRPVQTFSILALYVNIA